MTSTSTTLGSVKVRQGGEGEAVSLAGEVMLIVIERPYAPGAPVAIDLTREDGPIAVEGKTIGSKRRADGRFDVRVRLVNLRREDRARLATAR